MKQCSIQSLYDYNETIASALFTQVTYPWELLPQIGSFILQLGKTLPSDRFDQAAEQVWIAKSAAVAQSACITGPAIIDEEAEIRHCAFLRGNVIVGKYTVVGNSTELKNTILFNHVQVPHYNYVGDSILGHYAHMGAGSITSNVKSDQTLVEIKTMGESYDTGLKKCGAMIGDHVEVGCNSVLNPGTIIGKNSIIYPLSMVRGVVAAASIYKNKNEIIEKYK
jgi:NDP-sugar pyrophosphorylase family protein